MKASSKLPKPYRPTLGRKMEEASIALAVRLRISLLAKGSSNIGPLLEYVDELKVLIQFAFDLRFLSAGMYKDVSDELIAIGKILSSMGESHGCASFRTNC